MGLSPSPRWFSDRLLVVALLLGWATACPAADPQAADSLKAPPSGIVRRRLAGDDWPCFLGPSGNNQSTERGLNPQWPEAGPKIVWQVSLGTGYSSPVTSEGRLFQFDRLGGRERLRAFESETGKPLWQFDYPSEYEDMFGYDNGPRASPVVDDRRVYTFGAEGMLHCVDARTGKSIWKVDTTAEFGVVKNFFGVGSTPVVFGDLLLVQVGGSGAEAAAAGGSLEKAQPNGTAIVAFDKRTGKVKYKLGDELASYSSPTLTKVGDRQWCFLFARGGLLGFDPRQGTLDFHFPWRASILESVNASNPVVVGDQVFISETYGPGSALLRFRPGGYDVVWSDADRRRGKSMQAHWSTAIHREGYLYGSSGRHDTNAELRCVELASGKVVWSRPDLTRTTLLYVDGYFVCLGERGALRLVKVTPDKYEEAAQATLVDKDGAFGPAPLLKYPAWAPPVLSHGLLYVRGAGRLVCIDLIPPDDTPSR
ncbi:MAG TPA: PQQ-binding-like beta-propeller repeat protein [Pirellulales bacterium]|jgi:outer membrane protein assembly factor BamB|nr:PQQ-binding-like beta-propeller repeat protein [Pirellulales bacterium]